MDRAIELAGVTRRFGALTALDRNELQAVVEHERAHLRGRHAWVLTTADEPESYAAGEVLSLA